jgi:transcriptional regulator, AraC family
MSDYFHNSKVICSNSAIDIQITASSTIFTDWPGKMVTTRLECLNLFQKNETMEKIYRFETVAEYNALNNHETLHPLVSIIDFSKANPRSWGEKRVK